jgi:catechol 2,3-dioxygenase-like lactoylglutathione lyase family enzyme
MQLQGTHHIALRTPNFAAMEEFYTQVLGFPVTKRWDDVTIVFIDIGSTTIELMGRDDASAGALPTGGWDHIALHVEDVDAAYQELVDKGVRMRSEPKNFQDVRLAFFFDPDGNVLELVEDPRQPHKA